MTPNLKKILKKDADWSIKKTDFSSQEIKSSLDWVKEKQQEAELRKVIDPSKLKLVVKL